MAEPKLNFSRAKSISGYIDLFFIVGNIEIGLIYEYKATDIDIYSFGYKF